MMFIIGFVFDVLLDVVFDMGRKGGLMIMVLVGWWVLVGNF